MSAKKTFAKLRAELETVGVEDVAHMERIEALLEQLEGLVVSATTGGGAGASPANPKLTLAEAKVSAAVKAATPFMDSPDVALVVAEATKFIEAHPGKKFNIHYTIHEPRGKKDKPLEDVTFLKCPGLTTSNGYGIASAVYERLAASFKWHARGRPSAVSKSHVDRPHTLWISFCEPGTETSTGTHSVAPEASSDEE